ncbi:MAG: ELWxxDGT repeat protein, partial [Saprospiraceae bacterium]
MANINPTATTGSSPSNMTKLGSIILFSANDGTNGSELWKSDGTAAGTSMVKDINPSGNSSPNNFVVMGGFVYFTANDGTIGGALWRSNGTLAGTTLVKDINPATSSSSFISQLTAIGTKLYFRGDDGTNGEEPWISDGTTGGTSMLKNIAPTSASSSGFSCSTCFGTFEFVEFNGFVYFNANDHNNAFQQNSELWRTDGTTGGTVLFKDNYTAGGGGPGNLVNAGSYLFFTSDNQSTTGLEPWKTDGTLAGTVMIKDIFNPGFNAGSITGDVPTAYMNGYVYFVAIDVYDASNFNLMPPQSGYINAELWRTDGTLANTTKVKEINPGVSGLTSDANPNNFFVFNNKLYFSATDGTNGTEPWVTDGTGTNTIMLKNIDPAGNSNPSGFTGLGGFIYFRADDNSTNGTELWRTDGTATNTVLVKDINPGAANGSPSSMEPLDANHMLLGGTNAIVGSELYILGGYKVAVTTGANGETNLPGDGSASTTIDVGVKSGSNATFTFTPDPTFSVQSLTVDGAGAGTPANYTFTNVTANHTLSVTFGMGAPACPTPPTAPSSAASDANNFCSNAGGTLSLSASGGSGTTVNWYTGSCGGTPVGTGNPLVIAKPTTTTTYYARWESPNCTSSACASVTVTVNALPTAPTSAASDVNNFCSNAGGTLSLSAVGGTGGTLTWYSGGCGSGGAIGTGSPLNIAKPTTTTTYYARRESPGCTPSACASVTVTVNALPSAPTSASSDANNFCSNAGGTLSLSAVGGTGGTLTWYSGGCGSGGAIGTGSPLNIAKPTTTTTYYARRESPNCTPSTCASVTVTVNPLPVMTCPPNSAVCIDAASFALTGATPPGGTYSGTGVSAGNFNPATAGVGAHTITYSYTDGNSCTNTCTFTITVNPLPVMTCPPNSAVCIDAASFALTGATPPGGTYSGTGVSAGNFNP